MKFLPFYLVMSFALVVGVWQQSNRLSVDNKRTIKKYQTLAGNGESSHQLVEDLVVGIPAASSLLKTASSIHQIATPSLCEQSDQYLFNYSHHVGGSSFYHRCEMTHSFNNANEINSKISQEKVEKIKDKVVQKQIQSRATTLKTLSDSSLPSDGNFKDAGGAKAREAKKILKRAADQGQLAYVIMKSEQMGLPRSVAFVPLVESSYQSNKVSPKGAAGAWQLMPALAREYGIASQERFHFKTATDAALKHLSRLYAQFGNWSLVFAAYNAGSNRVERALKKNPHATSIYQLDLPRETKDYVRKLRYFNQIMQAQ